jgi:isopropylmalate/homocitrate/citramalate synthase
MNSVRIVEVGPCDGLQNIHASIPTSTKLQLIERLLETGNSIIELTSVVSPRRIPQLADCRESYSYLDKTLYYRKLCTLHLRRPVHGSCASVCSAAQGCYKVSLGDALGVGSPAMVRSLLWNLNRNDHQIPTDRLAGHFHDTFGQGLANIREE